MRIDESVNIMTTVSMQKINQDLVDLWASYNHLNHALAPMQYPNGEEGAILFVGINPSFSAKGWNTVLNKAGKPTINGIMFNNAKDVEKYLQWPSSNLPPSYPAAPCLESLAHQHYSQFLLMARKTIDALNNPLVSCRSICIQGNQAKGGKNTYPVTLLAAKGVENAKTALIMPSFRFF
jgi:hypothetical protein